MLFDTHAHYYSEAFDPDRDEVLSALPSCGGGAGAVPRVRFAHLPPVHRLGGRYPHVYAAAGVHPRTPWACRRTGWTRWRP